MTWFPVPFQPDAFAATLYSQHSQTGFQVLVLLQLALVQFALPQPAGPLVLLQSVLAPPYQVNAAAVNADAHLNSQSTLVRVSVLQPLVQAFLGLPVLQWLWEGHVQLCRRWAQNDRRRNSPR